MVPHNIMARKQVSVRLAEDIIKRLDSLTNRTGLRRGELIRTAITQFIEDMEATMIKNKEMFKLVDTLKNLDSDDLATLIAEINKELNLRKYR